MYYWLKDLNISQLCDKGNKVVFDKSRCTIENEQDNKILFVGNRHENVYVFHLNEFFSSDIKCFASLNDNSWLWHRKVGHAHMDLLSKLSRKELVIGLSKIKYEKDRLYSMPTW